MTQIEYDLICKCIEKGAPACSDVLILSLNNIITENKEMQKQTKDKKKEK